MRYLIISFFLIFSLYGFGQTYFSQEPGKAKFDSLLIRAKIDFNMPDSCEEVIVKFMHKIPHNYAVGPKDSSFQIRYWVQPLDTRFADYNKKSEKKKKKVMHPDASCKSMMMLSVLDASGNKSSDYQVSEYPEMTKKIYNADWEAAALVESGWPQEGYKYCYIMCLHKDGVADIFMYVLADKKEDIMKINVLILKSIKFQ
jgi:hypothetical protein